MTGRRVKKANIICNDPRPLKELSDKYIVLHSRSAGRSYPSVVATCMDKNDAQPNELVDRMRFGRDKFVNQNSFRPYRLPCINLTGISWLENSPETHILVISIREVQTFC